MATQKSAPFGIYLHIPFCRKKCGYCDFYSIEKSDLMEPFINALCREIKESPKEQHGRKVTTLYFGGGTPSMVSAQQLERVLNVIRDKFQLSDNIEFTLEANPGSLTPEKAMDWRSLGFNRVSLGIQSFDDEDLKFLDRSHSGEEAKQSISFLHEAGFDNINLDLIFGIPGQPLSRFHKNLEIATSTGAPHLSIYGLSIENGTPLYKRHQAHEFVKVNDESYESLFLSAHAFMEGRGYSHYEISNYAKPGFESNHNVDCWYGADYLGFGPSAHSRIGLTRFANPSDIDAYLHDPNSHAFEITVTPDELETETTMLEFRTNRGTDSKRFKKRDQIEILKARDYMVEKDNRLILTPSGMLLLDEIILRLDQKKNSHTKTI